MLDPLASKIAFISDGTDSTTGKGKVSSTNYQLLCELFGEKNVYPIFIENRVKVKRWETYIPNTHIIKSQKRKLYYAFILLSLRVANISKRKEKEILEIIRSEDFTYVYIDESYMGFLVRKIKKRINSNIKIIVFFHDVKYNLYKSLSKSNPLKYIPLWINSFINERLSLSFSNYTITLNERESKSLKNIYRASPSIELPILLKDIFDINKKQERTAEPILTFIGADYKPNVEGLSWFLENVFPSLSSKYTLKIIGKGMEKYRRIFGLDRVEVIGTVDSIDKFYYESDIIIAPIFSGGGMKVKTAEAMMFGKNICGSTEAFEGYETDSLKNCVISNQAQDYIKFLNNYIEDGTKTKHNNSTRETFLQYYEYRNGIKILKQLLR